MSESLAREIAHRKAYGATELSVQQLASRFAALGYKLDQLVGLSSTGTIPRNQVARTQLAQQASKSLTLARAAFHYAARRDDNFKAMQTLRNDIFAVSRGAILEV